ncbi:MAG: hypothetical protein AAGH65_04420 [Pseudomonadota bacterium]
MMDWVNPSLVLMDGFVLSLLVGTIVLVFFNWKPRICLSDLPEDIQAMAPPLDASEARWKLAFGLMIVSVLLVAIVISTMRFGTERGFLLAVLHAYLLFQIFNLVDFAVIDVGFMLMIDPANPPIEGTENAAGYRNVRFHFLKSVKGIVLGIPFALIAAGLAWLITAVVQ